MSMREPRPFKMIGDNAVVFHHAYIGLLLSGWEFPINVIGLLILLDDIIEHTITVDTPLRILFDKYIYDTIRE